MSKSFNLNVSQPLLDVLFDISKHKRNFNNRRTLREVVAEIFRVASLACRSGIEFRQDEVVEKFEFPWSARCLSMDSSELVFRDITVTGKKVVFGESSIKTLRRMSKDMRMGVNSLAHNLFHLGFVIWAIQVKPHPNDGFFATEHGIEKRLELFSD
ncbi:hypothetical protein A3H26_01010 [candidate division WWE3 bacterium RIFCSPLOWO2_12_FULL_36_10]|uniref:Uncharacterized protein n=1 Tax=candidate division WWE3 bacterium RIFCSPLOWO2_12_FULL_36_10 TaxID=1802630 RepID=A0A1F4VHJ2_UNCKA|nr:MAG: hypothetical protein A3H26_01010 [candidate division WWE3 bacterium RIFCSPLOWO2_12_FULL_36_10]